MVGETFFVNGKKVKILNRRMSRTEGFFEVFEVYDIEIDDLKCAIRIEQLENLKAGKEFEFELVFD